MHFTNRHNLPDTILRASRKRNELYNAKADRSVTQLINPPQIDVLRKRHFKEMTKDVSEEFFALFGSAVHQILEWAADGNGAEERLFVKVGHWTVSGQIDLQRLGDDLHINDYKVTSSYGISVDDDPKWEWVAQLNLYAYLVWRCKGVRVASANIIAIIRDFSNKQAQMNPAYPQTPIVTLTVPLWTVEEQEAYLLERVRAHQEAEFASDMGLPLPECTPAERWSKPDKWAVTKKGNKRAKVFTNEVEAKIYAEEMGVPVEYRPGESTRCVGNYCQVSGWCAQSHARRAREAELAARKGDQAAVLSGEVDDQSYPAERELPDPEPEHDPQDIEEPDMA